MFEKLFKLKENNTNVRTEIFAGLTTFVTMAYIMFVNPSILSATGMDWGAVFVATILAAAIGTFVMAFVANVPYAQAPGMGLNALFTYTVCLGMGLPWQQALGIVFICGVINIVITVTKIRKSIIKAIPTSLQYAIGGGIGLFIAYIGFINGHLLDFTPDSEANAIGAFSKIIPALVNFSDPVSLLALIGLVIIVVLMLLKVKGAILIGIILTTLIGIPMGVTVVPEITAASFIPPSIAPTFFKLDIFGIFADPSQLFKMLTLILTFSLTDTFDTIGTFLGTGRQSGIFDDEDEKALMEGKGFSSRLDKALFADATATSMGALLGTSNTTTYVESAAGIAVGGKTGLTSLTVGILFILSLFLSPIAGMVPGAATAPALIVVGILMVSSLGKIKWDDFEEALPAFFTVVAMPFAYSISTGVALGFVFFCLAKIFSGKAKQVHPIMYIVTGIFVLKYILDAVSLLL
ncbi:MAG: NCS2 family permease [Clostridiaceae bacterium]|jgi:AGZA family xanthine/uracil permease-like MFS transporter|nr:NCS2 family permease [Clostridiaceae bacterium]